MCSRQDDHDDQDSTKTARLAELWSELLELRRKVDQAETKKKQKSDRQSRTKQH
jgi:hypothetical protein